MENAEEVPINVSEKQDENVEEKTNATTSSPPGSTKIEESIPVLLCTVCRMPLVQYDEILSRAPDAWGEQVYAYELDLFADKSPLWCYSATNPSANRFDIIRCNPAIALQYNFVKLTGDWSPEHSFFIGHEWRYAKCRTCKSFLGWGFRPTVLNASNGTNSDTALVSNTDDDNNNNNNNKVSFVAIILTRCVGDEEYPESKYKAYVTEGSQGWSSRGLLERGGENEEEENIFSGSSTIHSTLRERITQLLGLVSLNTPPRVGATPEAELGGQIPTETSTDDQNNEEEDYDYYDRNPTGSSVSATDHIGQLFNSDGEFTNCEDEDEYYE